MYSVYFTATLCDDAYGSENSKKIECGVLTGVKDYVSAMDKIECHYGDTLEKIELELFNVGMLCFTPEQGEEIRHLLEGREW